MEMRDERFQPDINLLVGMDCFRTFACPVLPQVLYADGAYFFLATLS